MFVAYLLCLLFSYLVTGSGLSVILLGIAYFANIHQLAYFILVQVFGGIMQVSVLGMCVWSHNRVILDTLGLVCWVCVWSHIRVSMLGMCVWSHIRFSMLGMCVWSHIRVSMLQWRRKMFFDGGLQFFKDTELNFQHKTPFGKD